jgi:hypothetical protein
VELIAPRTARLVGVDDETLAKWSERGITRIAPDEAALMRASEAVADELRARQLNETGTEDYGYVPRGPVTFADESPRPHAR